jgi:hypothetical protein
MKTLTTRVERKLNGTIKENKIYAYVDFKLTIYKLTHLEGQYAFCSSGIIDDGEYIKCTPELSVLEMCENNIDTDIYEFEDELEYHEWCIEILKLKE